MGEPKTGQKAFQATPLLPKKTEKIEPKNGAKIPRQNRIKRTQKRDTTAKNLLKEIHQEAIRKRKKETASITMQLHSKDYAAVIHSTNFCSTKNRKAQIQNKKSTAKF
jgi:hypothetical protein